MILYDQVLEWEARVKKISEFRMIVWVAIPAPDFPPPDSSTWQNKPSCF